MEMIRNQDPGKTLRLRCSQNVTQAGDKRLPISIILKNFFTLNSLGDDVLENARKIQSG
jgi:hypothetical protein